MVQAVAAPGATVHTDGTNVYDTLDALGCDHHKVIHSIGECVCDGVHTNTVENFWSLLKRTYHYMSAAHLHHYVEQQTFRFNRRQCHVTDRMADAAAAMSGRRLPWRELVLYGPHASSFVQTEPW